MIERTRPNAHQGLACVRLGKRYVLDLKDFRPAVLVKPDCFHELLQRPLRAG
jgi:hypothetical protein